MTLSSAEAITLKDILALPVLVAAGTRLLSEASHLDQPIRWVHVVDTPRGGELIDGGELLLTTGASLGKTAPERYRTIDKWVDAGAAALLIEIGVVLDELPQDILEHCAERELPLIVTAGEVRFLEVTEAVHSAVLSRQFQQVEQLQRINESFWSLMYNRAQAEQLILHTSRELALPVVLEDLAHRVILYAEGHELPSQLLQGWEGKSRRWASDHSAAGLIANPVTVQDPENSEVSWSFIDIQGQGIHWGRLFVRGAALDDTLTLHTMRHAAMALTIERLGALNPHAWTDLRERMGLKRVLKNRFTTVEGQKVVLESNGFHTDGRALLASELRSAERLSLTSVRDVLLSISPDVEVMVAHHENNSHRVVCIISANSQKWEAAELAEVARQALAGLGTAIEFLVATGPRGPIDLSSALHRMSALNAQIPETGVALRRADRNQFDGLVNYLHQDVRVQEFGETTLQPVLLHDARNDSDLMVTLSTLLEHPTSRSAAAQELHLSRTALYSRIATIERLLAVDLNKGEDFFGLSLAVRSYYGA